MFRRFALSQNISLIKRNISSLIGRNQTFTNFRNINNRNISILSTFRNDNWNEYDNMWKYALAFIGIGGLFILNGNNKVECKEYTKYYSYDEVNRHKSKETGIWVTYGNSVYDITKFIENHPGGTKKILLASGGPLEPFWDIYKMHTKGNARKMLSHYKIGELNPNDKGMKVNINVNDPYKDEPFRYPILTVNSEKPFNAEPTRELLSESYITPNDIFYIRNHLPVPKIDVKTYRLKIERPLLGKSASFSLDELKRMFEKHEVVATIQCAGNRRDEMSKYKEVRGLGWKGGAIGTAIWGGVRLSEVLRFVGIHVQDLSKVEEMEEKHIEFVGLDHDDENTYGASIPIINGLNPLNDVILAYEMNGEPLPADHGYPLRAIVPGTVGARNVKWLSTVKVSKEESDSHWQQRDYKGFGPYVDWSKNNLDYDNATSIQELPVQSAICLPSNNETIDMEDLDEIEIKGYAWSGGGKGILRVDVSIDGGETWLPATLKKPKKKNGQPQDLRKTWAWTRWTLNVPVDTIKDKKELKLICKAVDVSYNTQPENFKSVWNVRGVLSTAWDRINVNLN